MTTKKKQVTRSTVTHLYEKHIDMKKKLAKKLDISESQVMREALEEKYAFHFNK